jgi:prefoldin subunit 5
MKILFLILPILFITTQSFAVPFAFEAGKPARASEVNANFNFLNTEIESLQTDHSALGSDISDLNADLFTLNLFATGTSNDLTSLSSTVSDLDSEVVTLEDAVIANTEDISLLDSAISAIESAISSIESAISSIESAITDLETRVSTLEDAPAGEACLSFNADTSPVGETLTYSYQSATLGQQFTMQGETFTIIKIPVKDIVSGKQYLVTAPIHSVGGSLITTVVEDKCFGNMSISGFPAQVEFEENFYVDVNYLENGLVVSGLESKVDRLWIKVGNIVVEMYAPYSSTINTYSFNLTDNNYDGSAVDTSGIARDTTFINNVDTFIDYIKIEEVTP